MADITAPRTLQRPGAGAKDRSPRPVDYLFLVLEGARPLSGGARWELTGIDEVSNPRLRAERKRGRLTVLLFGKAAA